MQPEEINVRRFNSYINYFVEQMIWHIVVCGWWLELT